VAFGRVTGVRDEPVRFCRFIRAEKANSQVAMICRVVKVSRSAGLHDAGLRVSRAAVAKVMRRNGVRGCGPRAVRRSTISDITYLRTWLGRAYLAIARRQPTATGIVHSDSGPVFASGQLARYARTHRLRLSVGATGACWGDALAPCVTSLCGVGGEGVR
jgi:transposase InsO family protein